MFDVHDQAMFARFMGIMFWGAAAAMLLNRSLGGSNLLHMVLVIPGMVLLGVCNFAWLPDKWVAALGVGGFGAMALIAVALHA